MERKAAAPVDKEGWLHKRGVHNKSYKKRYFVLRNKVLKYYQKQKDVNPKGKIMLQGCQIRAVQSSKPQKNRFEFEIYSDIFSRVYYVYADDENHRQAWISALNEHVAWDNSMQGSMDKKHIGMANIAEGDEDNTKINTPSHSRESKIQTPVALLSGRGSTWKKDIDAAERMVKQRGPEILLDVPEQFFYDSDVSADYSSWRRGVASRGINEALESYLKVTSLDEPGMLKNASTMRYHNDESFVVLGAHASQKSRILRKNDAHGKMHILRVSNPQNRKESTADSQGHEYNDEPGEFAVVNSFDTPCMKVNHVSWLDDLLLVGAEDGRALLYKCDPMGNVDEEDYSAPRAIFLNRDKSSYSSARSQAIPGRWCDTSDVHRVELNPDRSSFLCLASSGYHVWDMSNTKKSLKSVYDPCLSPLFCASWNPHEEKSRLFAVAGVQRALHVVDLRIGQSVSHGQLHAGWSATNAHDDIVRDVQWSPLVESWIASAGDDGIVKVWDLRYAKQAFAILDEKVNVTVPNRILQGHASGVSSVAWSNSHPDVLVSGGDDGLVKIWNLQFGPHYVITTSELLDAEEEPIISVGFSQSNPTQVVALSEGHMDAIKLSNPLMHHFVSHKEKPVIMGFDPPDGSTEDHLRRHSRAYNTPSRTSVYPLANPDTAARPRQSVSQYSSPAPSGNNGRKSSARVANLWSTIRQRARSRSSTNTPVGLQKRLSGAGDTAVKPSMFSVMNTVQKEMKRQAQLKLEQQVERQLYMRDFEQAYSSLVRLAAQLWREKDYDHMSHVLTLASPTLFETCQAAATDKGGDFSFTNLLDDICRSVPPTCVRLSLPNKSDQQNLQLLSLKLNLMNSIRSQNYKKIILLENKIYTAMKSDIKSFLLEDGDDTLELLVITLLKFDHVKAMDFAQRCATRLQQMHQFPAFVRIAHRIVSPTIYTSDLEGQLQLVAGSKARVSKTLNFSSPNEKKVKRTSSANPFDPVTSAVNSTATDEKSTVLSADGDMDELADELVKPDADLGEEEDDMPGGALLDASQEDSFQQETPTESNEDMVAKSAAQAEATVLNELRVPKNVFSLLQLMSNMFMTLRDEENKSSDEKSLLSTFNPYVHTNLRALRRELGVNESQQDMVLETLLNVPPMPSSVARSAIRVFEEAKARDPNKLVISQAVQRIYFSALLQQKSYDKCLVHGTHFVTSLPATSFGKIIAKVMDTVVVPRFARAMDKHLQKEEEPWNTVNTLISASLSIMNIVHACAFLPEGLEELLPNYLERTTELLEHAIKAMFQDSRYKSSKYATGKHPKLDAQEKAKHVIAQVDRVRDQTHHRTTPFFEEQVETFISTIKALC